MSFQWIRLLWLLLLIPVLIFTYILLLRRKQKFALRYASLSLVKEAMVRGPGIRRHIPPALFLLGLAVMIFALARPEATVLLPSYQGTIILTIDISGSMRADDIKPNRIEAAKAAARAFVEKQPNNVLVGIVAFSATSALVQAPTRNREDVLAAIDRLATQRGTAVGSGILSSLRSIFEGTELETTPSLYETFTPSDSGRDPVPPGSYKTAVIVLLSDGQSNRGPDPMEAAEQAANLGVRVYTVGLGDPSGMVMNFYGHSVRVRLDEESLKSIARITEGSYFKAGSEAELISIYEELSTKLVSETEKTELTVFFTAA
ncbi:MAG: VWA domain-containing protein, partial [Spirochaetales bacterium]